MLYEIAGTNTRILGSMHMVPPGRDRWMQPVRSAFDWSEQIYVEMKEENYPALLTAPTALMARDMPSDLYAAVSGLWPALPFTPLAECNLLGASLIASGVGVPSQPGVESLLRKWAGPLADVRELESPEDFVRAGGDVPTDDLVSMTWTALRSKADGPRNLAAKYRAWQVHDLHKLEALLQIGTTERARAAIFGKRNQTWGPVIADASKSAQRTLIVCGCGHLCGPNNLRQILEREYGFVLKRLYM
jgi:uncharacterized protein YbaP (TraB family)